MKTISLLDTSITSYNLGNQIIMEAIYDIIEDLFPGDFLYRLPWEGHVSRQAHAYMRNSDYVFFGGTNSLSSHVLLYKQMGLRLRDLIRFSDLTLLGMGWWQYQNKPDIYTSFFWRRLLSSKSIHSVRDDYTMRKLLSIGVSSVANTCCPTTWKLTPEHCTQIPSQKARNVVMTLTDYSTSRDEDATLLRYLSTAYAKIYYWIQGVGDLKYIRSFGELTSHIEIIPPNLTSYDGILLNSELDYVGTRLHAGIRAIQHGKRALILEVDNRAKEMSRDIKLNTCSRSDYLAIKAFVEGAYSTDLIVPFGEIDRWKTQFV